MAEIPLGESGELEAPRPRRRDTDSRLGGVVHRWGSIVIALVGALVAIVTSNNASAHDSKDALRRVGDVEAKLGKVEDKLENLPTRESITALNAALGRVQDDIRWLVQREADRGGGRR